MGYFIKEICLLYSDDLVSRYGSKYNKFSLLVDNILHPIDKLLMHQVPGYSFMSGAKFIPEPVNRAC